METNDNGRAAVESLVLHLVQTLVELKVALSALESSPVQEDQARLRSAMIAEIDEVIERTRQQHLLPRRIDVYPTSANASSVTEGLDHALGRVANPGATPDQAPGWSD